MVENETILQNDKLIADSFNNCFCNIVKNQSVPKDPFFEEQTSNLFEDEVKALKIQRTSKHSLHQNKILNTNNLKFTFNNFVSFEQSLDEIYIICDLLMALNMLLKIQIWLVSYADDNTSCTLFP